MIFSGQVFGETSPRKFGPSEKHSINFVSDGVIFLRLHPEECRDRSLLPPHVLFKGFIFNFQIKIAKAKGLDLIKQHKQTIKTMESNSTQLFA